MRIGQSSTRTRAIRTRTLTTPTRTPTSTTPASGESLARCLEPVGADEFLGDYWEQKPLVIERGEHGRFDDLLSTADVERLICSTGIRHPAFRIVKEGAKFDVRELTIDLPWRPASFTGTADVDRVLAEFEQGASIVLQGLHYTWLPLALFCRGLEGTLGHPVQANAYYTPRAAQGLAVHHDTHDVFVLQVSGEKRWLVYEPVLELPLKDQRYSRALGEPGEPVHDLTLRAGDTLYLPRGWLHEALTSETDSLHLTIGINVYTWLDAFKAALASCSDEVGFRRSVGEDGTLPAGLVETLESRLGPDAVRRRRRTRLVATRKPIRDGQLSQLHALERVGPETVVERRPSVLADLEESDGALTLAFEGKLVRLPAHARAEVTHAFAATEPFRPRELPGDLDEHGRLVLVRRLIREGFLRAMEPIGRDGRSPRSGEAG
jgi:Cupin superfamily protein